MRELKNQMSLSSLNVEEEEDRLIRVWLLSSLKLKKKTHYRLAARFRNSGQTWTVNRRYSEFLLLNNQLIQYFTNASNPCPACENYLHALKLFEFPRKHLFASNSSLVVNYRTRALRAFLNLLASWSFSTAPKCPTCAGFPFDAVKDFILKGGEPYQESDMDAITSSFTLETFVNHSIEKSGSSRSLKSAGRKNSWIPASESETLQAEAGKATNKQQRPSVVMEDPYENFNDYLPGQPEDKTDNMGNVRDHAIDVARRANDSFISLTGSESGLGQQEYMPVFKFLRDESGNGKAVPVGAEPTRYGSHSVEQRYGSLSYIGPNEPIRKSTSSFVSERSSFAGHVETPKKTPQGKEGTRSESHSLFGSFISDSAANDPLREAVIFPPRSSLGGLMEEKLRSSFSGRRMEDRLPQEHQRHSETIRQPWEVAIKG